MDNFGFWADIGAAQKTAAKSPDSKTHDLGITFPRP